MTFSVMLLFISKRAQDSSVSIIFISEIHKCTDYVMCFLTTRIFWKETFPMWLTSLVVKVPSDEEEAA